MSVLNFISLVNSRRHDPAAIAAVLCASTFRFKVSSAILPHQWLQGARRRVRTETRKTLHDCGTD